MTDKSSIPTHMEFDEKVMRLVDTRAEEALRHIAYIAAIGSCLDVSEPLAKLRLALDAAQAEVAIDIDPFHFVQEPGAPWGIGTIPGSA